MKSIEIEKAIKEIDPIHFEGMINDIVKYIYKSEEIKHVEKTGMSHGSLRTKKGTPDIKILTSDKNVAIQCSVEKNISNKIDKDIQKCLDICSKNKETLHEICFCYNGNIPVEKINKITNELENKKIKFRFIGIDDIRRLIYLECPIIAHDWLNIPLSNGSLISLKKYEDTYKFKSEHDAEFLYREQDKEKILELLNDKYVLISGKPGDGKTRLAIEVAKLWKTKNDNEVFVLDNNTYDFSEDFERFLFSGDNEKLLIIDDINRLSILDRVLQSLRLRDLKNKIHILATVRDYAEDSIIKNYQKEFNLYKLAALSKDEIKNIISKQYKIIRVKYLDYILNVSKGNLRFAIMAAKSMLKDENSLPSISSIVENYYHELTKDLSLTEGQLELRLLRTLGVFSFFEKIYLKDTNSNLVQKILNTFNIPKDEFEYAINYWDNKEIIKYLFDNNIASMDDQILRAYIFKYVFIDKKYLNLYDLIKDFFNSNLGNLVDIINSINYIYGLQTEITENILKVQNELYEEDSPKLYSYLESLQMANPIDSVYMIKTLIKNNKLQYMPLLLSYSETEYFGEVLNILFDSYVLLDNKLKETVEKGILDNFIPSKHSYDNNYNSQISLFKKLLSLDDNYNDIALKIVKSHCSFAFQRTESAKMALNIYTISLGWNDGAKKYRKLLWELINRLYKSLSNEDLGELCKAITNYHTFISAKELMENEFELYKNFILQIKPTDLYKKLLKYELAKNFSIITKTKRELIYDFSGDILLDLLTVEEKNSYKWPYKYDELKKKFAKLDLRTIKSLIRDLSKAMIFYGNNHNWSIVNIVSALFDLKTYQNFNRLDVLKLLNIYCPNIQLSPSHILSKLNKDCEMSKIRSFLKKSKFQHKWNWVLSTYMFEPIATNRLLVQCKNHFRNINETQNFCGNENVLNLKKYFEIDKNFYINITKIVLENGNVGLLTMFETIFYQDDISMALELYTNDINVLIDLYFKMIEKNLHIDYDHKFINYFIDLDRKNLVRYLNCKKHESFSFIWKRQDAEKLIRYYIDEIFHDNTKYLQRFDLENILAEASLEIKMKIIKDIALEHFDNHIILFELSCLVSDYKKEQQRDFIKFLINNKYPPEKMGRLALVDGPHSWTGSEVPLIEDNIKFLDKLITEFTQEGVNSDYLVILNQLKKWKENRLLKVKIDEYNKGYLS